MVFNDPSADGDIDSSSASKKKKKPRPPLPEEDEEGNGQESEPATSKKAATEAPAPAAASAGGLTLADMPQGLSKLEEIKWKKANLPPVAAGGKAAAARNILLKQVGDGFDGPGGEL